MQFPSRPDRLSCALRLLFAVVIANTCFMSHAESYVVLTADDSSSNVAFVRALQDDAHVSDRFDVVHVEQHGSTGSSSSAAEAAVDVGVRTRGLRGSSMARWPRTGPVTIAVGLPAARVALARSDDTPLMLTMLSWIDYDKLRTEPAFLRPQRRIGVLLRDPSIAALLALVEAVLPQRRRLAILATPETAVSVQELRRVAPGWNLRIEVIPDSSALADTLRVLLPQSDALLLLPDALGDNQAATLAVLRACAVAGVPVFGTSEGLVRSGAIAAVISTPRQLALQARSLTTRLLSGDMNAAWVDVPSPAVRTNLTVARRMGLSIADEGLLTQRVSSAR